MRTPFHADKMNIGTFHVQYSKHKITPEEELIQSLLIGDFKTLTGFFYNLFICAISLIAIVTLIVNMTYWC